MTIKYSASDVYDKLVVKIANLEKENAILKTEKDALINHINELKESEESK